MFTLIGLNANPLSIISLTKESPNTFLPIPIAPLIYFIYFFIPIHIYSICRPSGTRTHNPDSFLIRASPLTPVRLPILNQNKTITKIIPMQI